MTMGIYGIFHNDLCLYIGQSVNIHQRTGAHSRHLSQDRHSLASLQEYVTNVGFSEITFKIISEIEQIEFLSLNELTAFNKYQPLYFGYLPSPNVVYSNRSLDFERDCMICGNNYKITNQRQKYCSQPCYYESRKRIHNCLNCKKDFSTFATKSEFCSSECLYNSKTYNHTCLLCNKDFTSPRENTKYCGEKLCLSKNFYYSLNCQICKSEFTAKNKKRNSAHQNVESLEESSLNCNVKYAI